MPPAQAGGEAVGRRCGETRPAEAVGIVRAAWLCQGSWSLVRRCLAASETHAGRANPLPNPASAPGPHELM